MEKRPSGLCDTEHRRLLQIQHQVKLLELGISLSGIRKMCLYISNNLFLRYTRQALCIMNENAKINIALPLAPLCVENAATIRQIVSIASY